MVGGWKRVEWERGGWETFIHRIHSPTSYARSTNNDVGGGIFHITHTLSTSAYLEIADWVFYFISMRLAFNSLYFLCIS